MSVDTPVDVHAANKSQCPIPEGWDLSIAYPPLWGVVVDSPLDERPLQDRALCRRLATWTKEEAEGAVEERRRLCERSLPELVSSTPPFALKMLSTMERDLFVESFTGNEPVWSEQDWWIESRNSGVAREHGVRVSRTDRSMLAYYTSREKMCLGLRTKIRPGRYLSRFFGDVLTQAQIKALAEWQTTGSRRFPGLDAVPVKFAKSSCDIVDVYSRGPASCMNKNDFRDSGEHHPCEVYGAGDLAIAYLERPDSVEAAIDVVARALCWPEKKVFGRVYPLPDRWQEDGFPDQGTAKFMADMLEKKLVDLGYVPAGVDSGFEGARLKRIDLGGGEVVMPYLDHKWCFRRHADDRYLAMTLGGISASSLHGSAHLFDAYTCWCCEEDFEDDGDQSEVVVGVMLDGTPRRHETWCPCCVEQEAWFDDVQEEWVSGCIEHVSLADGRRVVRQYAVKHGFQSAFSEEWFLDEDAESVEMVGGGVWTDDEFHEHGFTCAATGVHAPRSEMHPDHPGVWRGISEAELAAWVSGDRPARQQGCPLIIRQWAAVCREDPDYRRHVLRDVWLWTEVAPPGDPLTTNGAISAARGTPVKTATFLVEQAPWVLRASVPAAA